MKYWKAALAGSVFAGAMVALSACAGTTTLRVTVPGVGTGEIIIEQPPKNANPPAPDPDEDTPTNQISHNGKTYDVYGSNCPTWAVNTKTGRMFYIASCNGDLAITAPAGGSGGFLTGVTPIGDPVIPGSIEDELQQEINRGFGQNALPIDMNRSAFDLLTQFANIDQDPSDPTYGTPVDMAWRFNALNDHFADLMLHLRTDQVILPPALYNVQYEMYIKNDMEDGLPGYVRVRMLGELNAVLAYLADMGYEEITVDDEIRGTVETVGADQDTRQISWNGLQVPGLFADPTPNGIE